MRGESARENEIKSVFTNAIGFFVGCWLDSIRWEKTIRDLLDKMEKKQDEAKK